MAGHCHRIGKGYVLPGCLSHKAASKRVCREIPLNSRKYAALQHDFPYRCWGEGLSQVTAPANSAKDASIGDSGQIEPVAKRLGSVARHRLDVLGPISPVLVRLE